MKKIWSSILAALILFGCSTTQPKVSQQVKEPTQVKVMALKGPTALGMLEMLEQPEKSDNHYAFTIASAVDEVSVKLLKNEVDIAAVPANLASVLYQKSNQQLVVLNVNTLGVLYLVSQDSSLTSLQDLEGKTIYASGKGATPEYILNYILEQNHINANVEWKNEHSEVVSALASDTNAIGLLPQPFVTIAKSKLAGLNVMVDLNQIWKDLTKQELITGVVVANKQFVQDHPDAIQTWMSDYEQSVSFTNQQVDQAATLAEKFDILKAAVAKQAIPECHIVFVTKDQMKQQLVAYYQVLQSIEPKSIGGQLPADDFYYGAQ